MISIKKIFTKQYNTGYLIGGTKDLVMRTMFYITALNFVLGAGTAYMVYAREWIDIKVFIVAVILFAMISALFEYKVVIPSNWKFINKQRYTHGEPLKDDIQKVLDGQVALGERLDRIEKELRIRRIG